MAVAFINKMGGVMLVHESKVDWYKAAGYMLAATPSNNSIEDSPIEDDKKILRRRRTKE